MKLRIYGFRDNLYDGAITYGLNNTSSLDKLFAFFLAVGPILQHYKGIYANAGLLMLLLMSPFLTLKLLVKLRKTDYDPYCILAITPLLLFQLYKMVDHTINAGKTLYALFIIVVFLAIECGCINIKYFMKCTTLISTAAGSCLIVQYILYYLAGVHLQFVPTSLLLPESSQWILGAQTGLYGINGRSNGFYRPSAFFLEPSHLFLYTFPVLCLLLLSPNINKRRKRIAVLVSAAMILSTSGMAAAVAIGIWGIYFALYNSKNGRENIAKLKNLFSGKNIIILISILILLIIAYTQVEVFRNMVLRIFSSGSTGSSTAIEGRTRLARLLVQGMSGKTLLMGVTENVNEINFNLSGFYATLYKYGVIGLVLSYLFYAPGIFKLKGAGLWTSLIIVIISFFTAHTHGTFYMMYFVIVIMNAYHMKVKNKTKYG